MDVILQLSKEMTDGRWSLQIMTGIERLICANYLLFLLTQDLGDAKENS